MIVHYVAFLILQLGTPMHAAQSICIVNIVIYIKQLSIVVCFCFSYVSNTHHILSAFIFQVHFKLAVMVATVEVDEGVVNLSLERTNDSERSVF